MRTPLQIQLVRLMRWAALFSLAFATVALVLLAREETEERAYKFIAAALGVGVSVLLGIGLLMLLSLGGVRVRGESVADSMKKEDNDPRP